MLFRSWDPQKPKIDPVDPPSGPHFGPICGQKGRCWGQKTRFSQKKYFLLRFIFYRFPDGLGPSKTQNCPFVPPNGPHLGPFCGHFGPIWGQRTRFSQNHFFTQNHFLSVPRWSGTLKNRKLPLYTPNGPQMTYIGFPDGLGPSKTQNWPFIPPNGPHLGVLRLFRSPRNPLGLAHKSSALFKP